MKKVFCVLMVVAILLAGCGKNEIKPEQTIPSAATNATTEATVPATTAPQETSAATTMPPETTEPAQLQERDVRMGILEGGTYTNEYVGIGITMDDQWAALPAEDLQALPENVREIFKGTELENVELTQFTDVMAENAELLVNFNVLYQKIGLQERLVYSLMDEGELIDSVIEMSNTLIEAYQNAGITVERIEKKNITFLGEERVAMHTVASLQGIPYYILQVYYYHLGAYSVTLTFGSFYEDNTQAVADMFYSLEK